MTVGGLCWCLVLLYLEVLLFLVEMAEEDGNRRKWLLLSEENILLNCGHKRMVNVVPLPSSVLEEHTRKSLDSSFEGRTLEEVAETIRDVCVASSATYESLVEYRCNALCGLWLAKSKEDALDKTKSELVSSLDVDTTQNVPFMVKLNVLLTIPLVKSLTVTDVSLRKTVSDLLLTSLQSVQPSSLRGESRECINQLEQLLLEWLEGEAFGQELYNHAASTYLALALAV